MSRDIDNVTPIEANLPHYVGWALCLHCHAHWVAVVPVDCEVMECSTCTTRPRKFLLFPDATACHEMQEAPPENVHLSPEHRESLEGLMFPYVDCGNGEIMLGTDITPEQADGFLPASSLKRGPGNLVPRPAPKKEAL